MRPAGERRRQRAHDGRKVHYTQLAPKLPREAEALQQDAQSRGGARVRRGQGPQRSGRFGQAGRWRRGAALRSPGAGQRDDTWTGARGTAQVSL